MAQLLVNFKDTGDLSVTFDLAEKPAGNYRIELENPDGSVCSKQFDVVEGKGGELFYKLEIPPLSRLYRPYKFTLEYGNIGDTDLPAPLFKITPGEGGYIRLFSHEEFHQNPIQILGIADEDPVDILPPGSLYTIEMEYKVVIEDYVPFYIKVIDQPDEPIDWDSIELALRPEEIDPDLWDSVWQNLMDQLGNTWGTYIDALRQDARRLTLRGQRTYDIRELFGLELNIAYGGYRGAISGFVFETDDYTSIENVTISAYQPENPHYAQTLTKGDGFYLLTGLPPGSYELEVEGYVIEEGASAEVFADEDLLDHLIFVTPGGEISGYVSFNGLPIEDALISARGENNETLTTDRTDQLGHYQLIGLPEDTYIIKVKVDGYVEEEKPAFFLNNGEIRQDIDFYLVKCSEIVGTVTDVLTGQAIETATVMVSNDGDQVFSTSVDENGNYKISNIAAGEWRIYASAKGFISSEKIIILESDGITSQDFALTYGASISGMIRDTNNNQIENALVFAQGSDNSINSTITDDNGYYEIEGLTEGAYTITVRADGYNSMVHRIDKLYYGEKTVGINFELISGILVTGIVTEEDDTTPICGAEIFFKSNTGIMANCETNSDGSFSINTLPSGIYYMRTQSDGYISSHQMINLSEGTNSPFFHISLFRGAIIEGTVKMSDGYTPIPDTIIQVLNSNEDIVGIGITDYTGEYATSPVPKGSYDIVANHSQYSFKNEKIDIAEIAKFNHNFTATQGRIFGSVLQKTNIPVKDSAVTLFSLHDTQSQQIIRQIITAADGSYSFDSLAEGDYILMAEAEGFARTITKQTLLEVESIQVNLQLTSGYIISGIITDLITGHPISNVSLLFINTEWPEKIPGIDLITDGTGFYSARLLPGEYKICVYKKGYAIHQSDIIISSSQVYDIALTTDGYKLSGKVVDSNTQLPICGAWLSFQHERSIAILDQTNNEGIFNIEPLVPGNYKVSIAFENFFTIQDLTIYKDENILLELPIEPMNNVINNIDYNQFKSLKYMLRANSNTENGPFQESNFRYLKSENIPSTMSYNELINYALSATDNLPKIPKVPPGPSKCKCTKNSKLAMQWINLNVEHLDLSRDAKQISLHLDDHFINMKTMINSLELERDELGFYCQFRGVGMVYSIIGLMKKDLISISWDDYILSKSGLDIGLVALSDILYNILKIMATTNPELSPYIFAISSGFLLMKFKTFHIEVLAKMSNMKSIALAISCEKLFYEKHIQELKIAIDSYNKKLKDFERINKPCQDQGDGPIETDPNDTGGTGGGTTGTRSEDPNEKRISVGVGTLLHILNNETIDYTILFENDPNASASAQLVTITDPLSSDLDWDTFKLGDMEFSNHHIEVPEGLTYYSTQVDLRPEGNDLLVDIEARFDPLSGIATWTFSAIDPDTGEFTEDPLDGFLPPNGDNHEGEGFVKFSISPRPGLSTGTKIENVATIIFDWNPSMDTPLVFNVIDAGLPASEVLDLPAFSNERFEVGWAGQDDADGSGIASYDIYVSENGGEYQLWLEDTTATSGVFEGSSGNTYAFYSIARDHVGNREQAPSESDAGTTASVNHRPSVPSIHLPEDMSEVITTIPTLSVVNSYDDDGDTLTYEFEIYSNTDLTPPALTSVNGVTEGDSTTSWQVGVALQEDTWYSWRSRAFDGIAYSEWMEGATFYVSQIIEVEMNIGAGWSMISLPIEPEDARISTLFPYAKAVFIFITKYELLDPSDSLEVGKGYWLYQPEAKTYTLSGKPIECYTIPDLKGGWSIVGGCSYSAVPSVKDGRIRAVFGFMNRYVHLGPQDALQPGKAYWINCTEQTELTVGSQ